MPDWVGPSEMFQTAFLRLGRLRSVWLTAGKCKTLRL